jgi:hypothetical protein
MWCFYEDGIWLLEGERDASFDCSTAEHGGPVGDRSDEWVCVIIDRVRGVVSGRRSEVGGFGSGHHPHDWNGHKRCRLAAEHRGPYFVGNHSLGHAPMNRRWTALQALYFSASRVRLFVRRTAQRRVCNAITNLRCSGHLQNDRGAPRNISKSKRTDGFSFNAEWSLAFRHTVAIDRAGDPG